MRTALAVLVLLAALALVAAIVVPVLQEGGQEKQTGQQNYKGGGQLAQRQNDQKPDKPSGGGAQNAKVRPSPVTTSALESAASRSASASVTATAQSTSEPSTAPSQSAGLTEQAAAETVREVYETAAAGDYGTSYSLLSQNFRQNTADSQANWAGTFSTLQSVEFVEGPTATVSGNTATVTGTTIARHTDRTERNTGTWTLVDEGGRWKLDGISVQTEQIQ